MYCYIPPVCTVIYPRYALLYTPGMHCYIPPVCTVMYPRYALLYTPGMHCYIPPVCTVIYPRYALLYTPGMHCYIPPVCTVIYPRYALLYYNECMHVRPTMDHVQWLWPKMMVCCLSFKSTTTKHNLIYLKTQNSLHLVSSLRSEHSRVPLQRPETGIHCLPVLHRYDLLEQKTVTKVQPLVIPDHEEG